MHDKRWEILWLLKFRSSQQVHLMMFTILWGPSQQNYLRTQVPQSQSLVPGSRQSELAIGWHDDIRYKVTVSFQTFKWKSIVCVIPGQLPHNKSFIYKTIVKHKRMNDFMINCWATIEISIKLKLEEIRTNKLYSHFKDLLRKHNARNSMVMTTDCCSRNLDI